MEDRTVPNTCLPPAAGREAPPLTAAASRPNRESGREGGGWPARTVLALAALAILFCLSGARVALAGPAVRAERLRAAYALDESVEESDGELIRRKLLRLLSRRDVRLFLKVIQTAEGGEPGLMVGGCRTHSLKWHPALTLPRRCRYYVKGYGYSTASGNFQITLTNFEEIAPFLGVRDSSETSQALVALELIRRGGGAAGAYTTRGLALKQRIQGGFLSLVQGDVERALCAATYDWASSSCSTLPASYKVVYAGLAEGLRKAEAARARARRAEARERLQSARDEGRETRGTLKTTVKAAGRAARPAAPRARGAAAGLTGRTE